tara:strand:+ start:29634 stop:30062 length:429 start_codon:yes stop_codon:yes gene_type:complete
MGVTYTAYMAIGLRLDGERLYEDKLVKRGEHDFDSSVLFHPQTGEKLWASERFPLDGSEYIDDTFGPFEYAGEDSCERSDWKAVVGRVLTKETAYYDEKQKAPIDLNEIDLNNLKSELRDYFEPLGLWDESQFGAWLIMRVC